MFDEEDLDLTEAERELERALRSLHPVPATIDPATAKFVAQGRSIPGRQHWWPVAAAAAAILMGGGAWLTMHSVPSNVRYPETLATPRPMLPAESPSLMVYRRALANSVAELDELLDRQTRAGNVSSNRYTTVGVLWHADLSYSIGEM